MPSHVSRRITCTIVVYFIQYVVIFWRVTGHTPPMLLKINNQGVSQSHSRPVKVKKVQYLAPWTTGAQCSS
jgi:hypothetical protein